MGDMADWHLEQLMDPGLVEELSWEADIDGSGTEGTMPNDSRGWLLRDIERLKKAMGDAKKQGLVVDWNDGAIDFGYRGTGYPIPHQWNLKVYHPTYHRYSFPRKRRKYVMIVCNDFDVFDAIVLHGCAGVGKAGKSMAIREGYEMTKPTRRGKQKGNRNREAKPQKMTCPYCGEQAVFTSSREVYGGRDYGMIYLCRPCQAWVGCHEESAVPLGRIANAELRRAKMQAHEAFDPLWKTGEMSRHNAYAWLSNQLGIPSRDCHIGMFDVEMCGRVVNVCQRRLMEKFV